jgi:hypothetical protein
MCLHPGEKWIFAGSLSGQISTITVDDFLITNAMQAHAGGIHAIACHRILPYVAAMSTERAFSIWRIGADGVLTKVAFFNSRTLQCENDDTPIPYIQSTSQALAFHAQQPRILTRTGSGGLLEVEFTDDGAVSIVRCVRLHGSEDLVAVRYLEGSNRILTMANFGEIAVSEEGRVLRTWRFGYHNVHWAEYVEQDTYLLASDTRQVIRLDVAGKHEPIVGPPITRDDLEHVTLNHISGRAFVAGFDGNVYEIDPETCESTGVIYRAPFKCRWVKTLESNPDVMILQCRNGGLHKIDLKSRQRTALIKETPEAIWTAGQLPHSELVMAGEAQAIYRLKVDSVDHMSRIPQFSVRRIPIKVEGDSHFKRLDVEPTTGRVVLGRMDGQIWIGKGEKFRQLCHLEMPVRDLCINSKESVVFACTEGGAVYKVHLDTGEVLHCFYSPVKQPLWAIAYNQTADLLAVAEREGSLYILNGSDFSPVRQVLDIRRPKRLKWSASNTLLWSRSVEMYRYDRDTDQVSLFVRETGNTIEDFIWDEDRRYLVVMNYNSLLILCDYQYLRQK